MTSKEKIGLSSSRVRGPPSVNVDLLQCPICHDVLWKPIACQSCETPFCSACINQWLANNPNNCPNRCETYAQRKCPPLAAKMLAQLQISCFYEEKGCEQVISYEALDEHEVGCGYQSQQCSGCQSEILKKDFDNHKSNCASIKLTCEDCKLVYNRGDASKKHTENICLREQLRQLRDEFKQNKHVIEQLRDESKQNKHIIEQLHDESKQNKHIIEQLHDVSKQNKHVIEQLRDESKQNKRVVQECTHQLNALSTWKNRMDQEVIIKFDDLPSAVEQYIDIPSIYRGLSWTGFAYGHELWLKKNYPRSGFVKSFMPGGSSHIAYFSEEASISVDDSNNSFTLMSFTACAAWNNDLQLTITGYRNSTKINKHTTTLLFGQPQCILLQWKDINIVTFKPSGGTAHPRTGAPAKPHVVITQLTIGPSH